jgi:hypothetical protein
MVMLAFIQASCIEAIADSANLYTAQVLLLTWLLFVTAQASKYAHWHC